MAEAVLNYVISSYILQALSFWIEVTLLSSSLLVLIQGFIKENAVKQVHFGALHL